MSTPYELTGRSHQKARTRQALIEAARTLLGKGTTPTVEQAAAAANVSRPTAYRYFPNQRSLLVAAHPQLDSESLLPSDAPDDVSDRLALVVEKLTDMLVEWEPQLRSSLRVSLDTPPSEDELQMRRGRAIGWFTEALAPLQATMGAAQLDHLVLAIRASVGIEALVWLTDVAGLSRPDAVAIMRWSAQALLDSATSGAGPPPARKLTRRQPRARRV